MNSSWAVPAAKYVQVFLNADTCWSVLNGSDTALLQILSIVSKIGKITEIEILPYHRLGVTTYEWLKHKYTLGAVELPSGEYVEERVNFLRNQKMVEAPIRVGGGFG